tara:strand:+ start:9732 stop:9929 length:198 start_codon:yes stop_codon:yes gene_type:complete
MEEKIKLIWDFRGPNGAPTAAHHKIHLKEFCEKEHSLELEIATSLISEMHSTAYVVAPKKPHDCV